LAHANLLGHAVTQDPTLEHWTMLTPDAPLIGMSDRAPDGVENVMVIRTGDVWTMVYSEGLAEQHLAYAQSSDLVHWALKGEIQIPVQWWMSARYGAPFIWRELDTWLMLLMGQDANERTRFGLFTSADAIHWSALPERG
jgi:sucrose-6-phosphate hydrolase SacC (GH32 family)